VREEFNQLARGSNFRSHGETGIAIIQTLKPSVNWSIIPNEWCTPIRTDGALPRLQGQIVGTFALLIMDNLGHFGVPSAVIEDVAVAPGWHGRGVGKTMMRYALTVAGTAGCYKAMLSANLKREQAHLFYDSLGFERHGYSFRVTTQETAGTVVA
jgi:GNAT superfamily N-acetyltransferase